MQRWQRRLPSGWLKGVVCRGRECGLTNAVRVWLARTFGLSLVSWVAIRAWGSSVYVVSAVCEVWCSHSSHGLILAF